VVGGDCSDAASSRRSRFSGCITVGVAGVGPLRGEGPVEPLDLPLVCVREVAGGVPRTVVGHHGLDVDPSGGEERVRAGPEPGSGRTELVVVDL